MFEGELASVAQASRIRASGLDGVYSDVEVDGFSRSCLRNAGECRPNAIRANTQRRSNCLCGRERRGPHRVRNGRNLDSWFLEWLERGEEWARRRWNYRQRRRWRSEALLFGSSFGEPRSGDTRHLFGDERLRPEIRFQTSSFSGSCPQFIAIGTSTKNGIGDQVFAPIAAIGSSGSLHRCLGSALGNE